jgi:membrane fusion protein (multidrug efflux system)
MRVTAIVLLLIAALAGGGYWLHATGQISLGAQVAALTQSAPASTPSQPVAGTVQSGQGTGKPRQQGGSRVVPVEVAESKAIQLSDDIVSIGSLLSDQSAEIASESNGRVVEILFQDGASVEQGDELFKLDGELVAAEVSDAKARLALAEATFKRNDTLRKSRNIAESAYDQAVAELALAKSALELALVRQEKLVVRSPFSGTLGFSRISVGAYVTAGQALVHLEKIGKLKARFSVPELEFASLQIGGKVSLTADAVAGEKFEATITAIDPLVDVNGRALQVIASLDNPDLKLRPGMLIRVTVLGRERMAVTVPESAVVPRGTELAVFAVSGEAVKLVNVATGKRRDGWVEIVSGLESGQQIVTAGATRLADGGAIKIVNPITAE